MAQSKRNYGIDLLRLVSMLYVVVLHTLGKGGILNAAATGSAQYGLAWFLELWAYGAVNIFGIISGYVGFSDQEKRFNYANYLTMWLQVVFYGVATSLVFYLIDSELVTRADLWKMFLPVTNDLYWYFSAYTGLVFLIPLLNASVRHCTKESLAKIFLALCLVFSVYSCAADRFELGDGYSFIWLILLYLLGAIMKKCRIGQNVSAGFAFTGCVMCCVISWLWKMHGIELTIFNITINDKLFANYLSITHVLAAILHVIAFAKLRIHTVFQKLIALAAPGAFAVYLLNNQLFIWRHIMTRTFAHLASYPPHQLLIHVIAFSFGFMLFAVSVDWLRQKLFAALHVKQAAEFLLSRIHKTLDIYAQNLLN